ncbi:CCN family member 3 precursor [Xenopus laevis]|uniref:CCN family member 3 n=1 Tax=Xenopus laevis TaxID=8355 RepID=CCN3_XENLA|nr:CCN family member 3 precursor [Xenopus laevis]P51609.1 RecName: Full=CCN family member 3; AltName: Full=Cellular communication network factor 3; AltName: Full=Protein NOV homolog; Short=Xnov; Flags: Precursor [Xenopus laevis]AAB17096.1 immediate early gene; secreted, extracellular protein involved in complex processes such as differentiation [Xenopus laevis]
MTPHLALCFILLIQQVASQKCPSQCDQCPEEPPSCAPSVLLILDGCGCCPVCARQEGESCSHLNPCQEDKGLYCEFNADPRMETGTCMALEGNSCVFDGVVYRNRESFQPSCKYHCTCLNGHIGCVPRCNLDLLLPGPDCPFPRRVKVPGECCEKWVCDSKEEMAIGGFAMAAYRPEATLGIDASDTSFACIAQTTEWSACSKTCGMGVSSRVTNRNARCEMQKQIRLCMVRSCEEEPGWHVEKKGKKCVRVRKTTKPIHFHYKNCTSVQPYKPKFCGQCSDGRCCTPHSTKTMHVEFVCPQKRIVKKPVMVISTCVCHYNCPQDSSLLQVENARFPGLKTNL